MYVIALLNNCQTFNFEDAFFIDFCKYAAESVCLNTV